MLLPALDSGRVSLVVLLDAVGQIVPAEGLGVGRELGGELLVRLVVAAVFVDGPLERFGGVLDALETGGLGEVGGVRGVEKLLPRGD